METQLSFLLVPMFVAVLLSGALAVLTWQYREKRAAPWLILILLGVAGWTLVYAIQVMLEGQNAKAFANNFRYPFVSLTTTCWLFFVLTYTKRNEWVTPQIVGLVFAIPLLTQVIIWTDYLPITMIESVDTTVEAGLTLLEVDYGYWFWVHAGHAYLTLMVGLAIFAKFALESRVIAREGTILIAAILISFVPLVVQDLGLTTLDFTPVFLSVTMLLFWYVIFGKELLEVVPVARKTIVEEIRDGIIVVDEDHRVVDYNPAATRVFGVEADGSVADGGSAAVTQIVGQRIDDISPLSVDEQTIEHKEELTIEHKEELTIEQDGDERHLTTQITPIEEGSRPVGWIILLQDVTELKQREQELRMLNRVVRHDIQNDMTVVRGHAFTAHERMDDPALMEPIIKSSNHALELTETVKDLLDTLTMGDEPPLQAVSLQGVLESELSQARATHDEATFELTEDVDPEQFILADNMVSSVFTNLFSNAVRHNDQDEPAITITVEETDDQVQVAVADNGPGIPDYQRTDVFGRGEKGLDSPGTGVGLYLVDTLMEKYGGTVRLKDNEPRGSIFVLGFQKADEPA